MKAIQHAFEFRIRNHGNNDIAALLRGFGRALL
jgi:hypothetical protein